MCNVVFSGSISVLWLKSRGLCLQPCSWAADSHISTFFLNLGQVSEFWAFCSSFRGVCYSTVELSNSVVHWMWAPQCPGFGQDRVNFHQNPGRGTAGWADPTPTWPNRARYSIPCAIMLGSGGGGSAAGTLLQLGSAWRWSCPGERVCGLCGSCRVFSLSVSLLFLFFCLLFC